MSTLQHFDTIVIGSGTSAFFAITALNKAGRKVAVVDERPFGGTCALRGCQPKKYLVANAEAVAMADHLVGKGISESPRTDWPALQSHTNEFLEGISEGEVKDFEAAGIATYAGHAQLTGPSEVAVDEQHLTADTLVIATGSTPRRADIPGATKAIDLSVVPSAAFTIPTLATVGVSEAEAKAQGLDFRVNTGSTSGWPSSKRIGESTIGTTPSSAPISHAITPPKSSISLPSPSSTASRRPTSPSSSGPTRPTRRI